MNFCIVIIMLTSICEVCMKSDMLCSSCQQKFENGELSQIEVDIIRYLHSLENRIKNLRDAKLIKVIDSNNLFIVTGAGDAAKFVGRQGSIVKALAKQFKKSIRIVEKLENFKAFTERLLQPALVNGINIVYKPEGESFKVRISPKQKNRLLISQEDFSKLIRLLYGKNAEIVFEE